jgi:hypothetical protein
MQLAAVQRKRRHRQIQRESRQPPFRRSSLRHRQFTPDPGRRDRGSLRRGLHKRRRLQPQAAAPTVTTTTRQHRKMSRGAQPDRPSCCGSEQSTQTWAGAWPALPLERPWARKTPAHSPHVQAWYPNTAHDQQGSGDPKKTHTSREAAGALGKEEGLACRMFVRRCARGQPPVRG